MFNNRPDQASSSSEDTDYTKVKTLVLLSYMNYYHDHCHDPSALGFFSDMTPRHATAVQARLNKRASRLATKILHATPNEFIKLKPQPSFFSYFTDRPYWPWDSSIEEEKLYTLKAQTILERDPAMLFMEDSIATSPTGAICLGSPIQLALGAGDIGLVKGLKESVFPKYFQGAEIAQALFEKQFDAQFPHYHDPITLDSVLTNAPDLVFSDYEKACFEAECHFYDARNIEQIITIKRALMAVVNSFTANNCKNFVLNETTQACIDKLEEALTPKDDQLIQNGLHFPLLLLAIATDSCVNFKDSPADLRNTYLYLVLGLVQRYLTAVDGQVLLRMTEGANQQNLLMHAVLNTIRQRGLYLHNGEMLDNNSPLIVHELGKTAYIMLYEGYFCRYNNQSKSFDTFECNGRQMAKEKSLARHEKNRKNLRAELELIERWCRLKKEAIDMLLTNRSEKRATIAF